jgi:NAD(P)-dependent dehydrogenase (short-subunit alcohol dehydrogenase family)
MTNVSYADKVVIITGGSSGIGKGCAEQFVNAGAKVVICCNDADEGAGVAAGLRGAAQKQGAGDADFIYCDVTRTDNIRDLIDTSISRYGRLDCLINNAGWHPPHKPIDEFSIQEFRDLLELNLVSVFTASKFALPHLRLTKGNIINMSSLVASIGQRYATTYVATKGAITALTKALAVDEAPQWRVCEFRFAGKYHDTAVAGSYRRVPRTAAIPGRRRKCSVGRTDGAR